MENIFDDYIREFFTIFFILDIQCEGQSKPYPLKEQVLNKIFIEKDVYKIIFERLMKKRLIRFKEKHCAFKDRTISSNRDYFVKFIKKNKSNNNELGKICQLFYELYKRKEVSDINPNDLLDVFSKDSDEKCHECNKYFLPHSFSKHLCLSCYEVKSKKDCPNCVSKGKENINQIWGKQKMCEPCKTEKTDRLKEELAEKIIKNCKWCTATFEAENNRIKYCSELCSSRASIYTHCECGEIMYRQQAKKGKLCICCELEKLGATVNKQNRTAQRKCVKCNKYFTIKNIDEKGASKRNTCDECKIPKEQINNCETCGCEINSKRKFCAKCAKKLVGKIKCQTCGEYAHFSSVKDGKCSICRLEEDKNVSVERKLKIIRRICPNCHDKFVIDYTKKGWQSIKICEPCKSGKNKQINTKRQPNKNNNNNSDDSSLTNVVKNFLNRVIKNGINIKITF